MRTAAPLASVLLALLAGCHPPKSRPAFQYDTPGTALDVAYYGNTLYVADGDSGLLALDVTQPEEPTLLWRLETPQRCQSVFANESMVLAGFDRYGFAKVRPSDRWMTTYTDPQTNYDVRSFAAAWPRVYVGSRSGIAIYDATDLSHMSYIRGFSVYYDCTDISLNETRMFYSLRFGGVQHFYLLANDSFGPGFYTLGEMANSVQTTIGGFCLFTEDTSLFSIYGIPNQSPHHYDGGSLTTGPALDAITSPLVDYIYVAESSGLGVYYFNVLGDRSTRPVHRYVMDGLVQRLAIGPDHVFAAAGDAGVYIVRRED
jgi:hypothetical protein